MLVPVRKAARAKLPSNPEYGRAWVALARGLRSRVSVGAMVNAIRSGSPKTKPTTQAARSAADRVMRSMHWIDPKRKEAGEVWDRFHRQLATAYAKTMRTAGNQALERLPKTIAKARKPVRERAPTLSVGLNPYSVAWIKENAAQKIVDASQQQKDAVRAVIERGYLKGSRPETIANQLKSTIGLTERQSIAVSNLHADMLARGIDEDKADAAAERYADDQLAYRAQVISRTEQNEAQNQGQQDAWLQARDEGELPSNTIRRWVAMPSSDRLCEDCEELDEATTTLDDPFESTEYGEVDCPPLHPQCRCMVVLDFE